jgi:hypothetical protein
MLLLLLLLPSARAAAVAAATVIVAAAAALQLLPLLLPHEGADLHQVHLQHSSREHAIAAADRRCR